MRERKRKTSGWKRHAEENHCMDDKLGEKRAEHTDTDRKPTVSTSGNELIVLSSLPARWRPPSPSPRRQFRIRLQHPACRWLKELLRTPWTLGTATRRADGNNGKPKTRWREVVQDVVQGHCPEWRGSSVDLSTVPILRLSHDNVPHLFLHVDDEWTGPRNDDVLLC